MSLLDSPSKSKTQKIHSRLKKSRGNNTRNRKIHKHPGWAKNSNELDSVPFVFNSQWFQKDFFNYCYITLINETESMAGFKSAFVNMKTTSNFDWKTIRRLGHDCYWTLERVFSSTALANKGLKLKLWCFISTYYALLLIHKVGICLHAHLNLYTSSLGNDFTYWEVLMNY